MEVVTSLSQGRTAAAQCGLFTHKSVPVIFEPPCNNAKIASEERATTICGVNDDDDDVSFLLGVRTSGEVNEEGKARNWAVI